MYMHMKMSVYMHMHMNIQCICFKSFPFYIKDKINSPGGSTGQVYNAPGLFHISLPKSRDTYIATRGVSKGCVMYLQL